MVVLVLVNGNPVLCIFGVVEQSKPKTIIPMMENLDGFEIDLGVELDKNFEFDPNFAR